MRVATLFSGGLAAVEFALKYENIDHEIVIAAEWDKYARKQYLEFHGEPKEKFYEDVRDVNGAKYENIDLLVFGSPCQDLSLAGKRKGVDGEKSSLFREGARILNEMKPKTFIFENVKGLLSSNGGDDYKEVVKTFQEMGYLIASDVLNAKEQGTAQNRERVFIVGFLDEAEYHAFTFPEKKKLTKTLRDYLEDDVDEKYYLSEKMIECLDGRGDISNGYEFKPKDGLSYANCLTVKYGNYSTDTYLKEPILKQVGNIDTKGYETATQKIIQRARGFNNGGVHDICPTISANSWQENNTLNRIRKLTPREVFRLQGIKDEDINLVNSDTQSYKIAGNAIEVNTMRALLRQLCKPSKTNTLFDFLEETA